MAPALPPSTEVLHTEAITYTSKWAQGFRIHTRHSDTSEESYFMKISTGHHGLLALHGEFQGTTAMYALAPSFCPRPIAHGTLHTHPDAHFYLCTFHHFHPASTPLHPLLFCKQLAALHIASSSPTGKFGFHCPTYSGDLPQDNTWTDSWEECFTSGLRHVLTMREQRGGKSEELNALLPGLFGVVIPRLLRPLESAGRKITPALVHGDLWCGNTGVVEAETGEAMVFDPASLWAHNEYELGNWRPARNNLRHCIPVYQALVAPSPPEADFDDRNALYSMRFNLHAAALFPLGGGIYPREIRRLIAKLAGGEAEAE
ncbi:Fructosamine/Ketosamine-3-kinase [Staphylotrichum tortipilum]|uniref:protein-ribulosamine 3-kinase n=1 Tax=Staphylotrichum tortipilum TaxID=2831512 RepID=A0AAN6MR51_9PEZI|nr:Fructosamine/Ketosamine-3-kinase [Staphylotrichum longicolle]